LPDTEGRLLLGGDVRHRLNALEVVPEPQVAEVPVLRVGRDDRGEAGLVETGQDVRQRVIGVEAPGNVSLHRPGVQHCRGRHDLPVDRLRRELRIGIHRIMIRHGIAPVANHRLIDRVAGRHGGPSAPDVRLHLLEDRRHLGVTVARVSPSSNSRFRKPVKDCFRV
jgi:hypothetical protein